MLGIQYAYDPNSTIVVRCIDPTQADFVRLVKAYHLELGFAKAAKNSKDGKGKTVRSFHSTTSTLFATVSKMVIAHGTHVSVKLVPADEQEAPKKSRRAVSKAPTSESSLSPRQPTVEATAASTRPVVEEETKTAMRAEKTEERYPLLERQAAMDWLKTHEANGAVFLVLNPDWRSEFAAWSETPEAVQVLKDGISVEDWTEKSESMKWFVESPEQMESRFELNKICMDCLDKFSKIMYGK